MGEMSANHNRFASVWVLIFDLDGTLIDSKLDLAHSVNAMLEHMGRALAPRTRRVYSYVGNGAPMLVRRALGEGERPTPNAKKGLLHFLAYYREHIAR